eukprot:9469973-Pyramimonas_sp.AAC.1
MMLLVDSSHPPPHPPPPRLPCPRNSFSPFCQIDCASTCTCSACEGPNHMHHAPVEGSWFSISSFGLRPPTT